MSRDDPQARGGPAQKDATEGSDWHLYLNRFVSRPIWLSHLDTVLKTYHNSSARRFRRKNFPARRFSPRVHDAFASLPSTHNELFDYHLSVSHYTLSPQHAQVTPIESHSYSSDDDQPLELDTASDDEEHDADMPAIPVEEGNLDTTTSMPSSKYFDEYKLNQQHPDSIHNKSNVIEKMSKDISDKVTAAESLSCMSSTPSGQVYSESASKAKVSYDILTGDEISVKGFLSMDKDDLENGGTIKQAFFFHLHTCESLQDPAGKGRTCYENTCS